VLVLVFWTDLLPRIFDPFLERWLDLLA
jgi:hypothetical protein